MPYLGINISNTPITLFNLALILVAAMDVHHIINKHPVEKFFTKFELINSPKIRKENRLTGYDIYLRPPMGKCRSDFNRLKEPLEQYLDSQVDISYEKKSIKVFVSNKKPSPY
jgi:hypothetical protein